MSIASMWDEVGLKIGDDFTVWLRRLGEILALLSRTGALGPEDFEGNIRQINAANDAYVRVMS